jgi:hypothetical protein
VGPRFSGKVREEHQRRERKWGTKKTKLSRFANPGLASLELLTRLARLDSYRKTMKRLTDDQMMPKYSTSHSGFF